MSLPVGTAYQVVGANSGATALTNLTVAGTATQIAVGTAGTTLTLSLPGGAAWTSYTPTVSAQVGTITTSSATGRYTQIGKIVFINITCTITTAGSGVGNLILTLPVNANTTITNQIISGQEAAITGKSVKGGTNATTVALRDYSNTGVIADGAVVYLSGTYEAA